MTGKMTPGVGQTLVHRFRKRPGQVTAEVIAVIAGGRVSVRVGSTTNASLTAAARAAAGYETNGWIFWGLKKRKRHRVSS